MNKKEQNLLVRRTVDAFDCQEAIKILEVVGNNPHNGKPIEEQIDIYEAKLKQLTSDALSKYLRNNKLPTEVYGDGIVVRIDRFVDGDTIVWVEIRIPMCYTSHFNKEASIKPVKKEKPALKLEVDKPKLSQDAGE